MKVKILSKDKNKITLLVSEVTSAFMNTLRREIMSEVPTMAIEDVEFRKNSGILYDEMVAHRLGLLPLSTDLKSYNLPDECKCKGAGCAQCQLKLTLKASATKGSLTVYAKDIKSKDPKVKPVYPDTPILRLHEGQEIEAEMTAVLGKGKDHSKWSPGLAWFKHYPTLKVVKQPQDAKALVAKYPKVLELKAGKLSVNQQALIDYDLVGEEIEKVSDGALKYEEKDDYVMFIESWGQLEPKVLVEQAINAHNTQLKNFQKLLKAK